MIKIMIVDDHALVRMGICRLLEDIADIEVVAEAESGEVALKIARETKLDVVLLDMKMPGIDGLEVTRRMQRSHPGIKIIAVTAFAKEPFPTRILQAGALGYLTKECGVVEMTEAIRKVNQGQRYLSSEVAQVLALNSLSDKEIRDNPFEVLSERELQVTLMISKGMSVQEIADHLCISSKTVNGYRYRLFAKLEIKNDVELVYMAMKYNLVDSPDTIER
jgi:two-component system invasion response regulator UvrY